MYTPGFSPFFFSWRHSSNTIKQQKNNDTTKDNMVSSEVTRNVVGALGNITSLCLFLSPAPTFIGIWRKGSVEQYSPAPYLAALINCMVWVMYGLPMVNPDSILVVTINGAGVAIEFVFITLFLIYADKKKRVRVAGVLLGELLFIAILASLVLTKAHGKDRSLIVGIVAICSNIMMYASPLAVMRMVIGTKSVEYMPFFLSFAAFTNGVAWSAYALIRFDPFILGPNGMGMLLSVSQLILYAVFYKSTQRQIAARKGKVEEVGLSQVIVKG